MRYNVGDIVKYRLCDSTIYLGKIIFNKFENDFLIKVETYGGLFTITKDKVLQNLTEETEECNKKNTIEYKVNSLRRFAFSINVGDYIVPYSESYEKVVAQYFNRKLSLNASNRIRLVYYADIIYKVIKSDINGFTFKVIKSRKSRSGDIFEISTKECERDGYFLITGFIPEHTKNEFSDDLPEVSSNSSDSFTVAGIGGFHVKYTLTKTDNQKKINDLEKALKEKQEENEKLKKELELAKKSEKHLEICESVLLEKDAEIEKLKEETEQMIKNERGLYKKLWGVKIS